MSEHAEVAYIGDDMVIVASPGVLREFAKDAQFGAPLRHRRDGGEPSDLERRLIAEVLGRANARLRSSTERAVTDDGHFLDGVPPGGSSFARVECSVAEAATILGRSVEQVRRYGRAGRFDARQVGRQHIFDRIAVEAAAQRSA